MSEETGAKYIPETTTEDFYKAGLVDEGIYRFEVNQAKIIDVPIKKENLKEGGPTHFQKMLIQTTLVENSFGTYNPAEDRGARITESIPLYGKALRRLAAIYRALTGQPSVVRLSEETQKEIIDYPAMAASMGGTSAWAAIMYRNRQEKNPDTGKYEDTDQVDAKYGWSFAQSPEQVRAPDDFLKRIQEAEEAIEETADEVPF
jgi:hypothetical protein